MTLVEQKWSSVRDPSQTILPAHPKFPNLPPSSLEKANVCLKSVPVDCITLFFSDQLGSARFIAQPPSALLLLLVQAEQCQMTCFNVVE